MPARAQNLALNDGNLFGTHFDAKIAARHHQPIGQTNDVFQAIDRGWLLKLCHDRSPRSHQRPDFLYIVRPLHEGQSDPVGAHIEREGEIGAILISQRRDRQDSSNDAHTFPI